MAELSLSSEQLSNSYDTKSNQAGNQQFKFDFKRLAKNNKQHQLRAYLLTLTLLDRTMGHRHGGKYGDGWNLHFAPTNILQKSGLFL